MTTNDIAGLVIAAVFTVFCLVYRKRIPVVLEEERGKYSPEPPTPEEDIAAQETANLITPPNTHWIDLKATPPPCWYVPMSDEALDAEFIRNLDRMFTFRDAAPENVRTIRSHGTDGPEGAA